MTSTLPTAVVPYLAVRGGAAALDFYAEAFGAVEQSRMAGPDGTIAHAEFTIGSARFFLADEWPDAKVLSPSTLGGYAVALALEVADAPALVERLAAHGATVERPVGDGPEPGTVAGWVIDPYGHRWFLSSRTPA